MGSWPCTEIGGPRKFFLRFTLRSGVAQSPIKHTKVAILFVNSFLIVFNVALVSNITLLTQHYTFFFFLNLFSFKFLVGKSVSSILLPFFLMWCWLIIILFNYPTHRTSERLGIIISMSLWPLHRLPHGGKNKKIKK